MGSWFGLYSLSMLPPMVVVLLYKEKPIRFLYNFRYIFLHRAERGIQLRNLAFNYVPAMGLL